MGKKGLVRGLIVSFMVLLIISIVSFIFDFYFKLSISLFLINFALLFSFKLNSFFNESQKKNEADKIKEPSSMNNFLVGSFKFLIIYGIPLIILLYILYFNFLPFGFDKTYILDIGSAEDITEVNSIYLRNMEDINRISGRINEGEISYRDVKSLPIYFILKVPIKLDDGDQIETRTKFKSNENLNIGLTNYERYESKPLFSQELSEYNLIKENGDIKIFARKGLNQQYKKEDDISKWIRENIPKGSKIKVLGDVDKYLFVNKEINYKGVKTEISTKLRIFPYEFYVYLGDNIDIELNKKDLNWYGGEDVLTISIYDLNDNLILSDKIEDDGITDNSESEGKNQIKEIKKKFKMGGTYKLVLGGNEDIILNSLKINSNKVVVKDRVYPLGDSEKYLKDYNPKKGVEIYFKSYKDSYITFVTPHNEALQNITLSPDGTQLAIDKRNDKYILNIAGSEWLKRLTLPKADVQISSPLYFSFSDSQYFDPYNYIFTNEEPDFIVSGNYNVIEEGRWKIGEKKFIFKKDILYDGKYLIFILNSPNKSINNISIDYFEVKIKK